MKAWRKAVFGCVSVLALGLTSAATAGPAPSRGSGSDIDHRTNGPSAQSIALRDVTEKRGAWDPLLGMYGHASIAGDANGDGWPDLVVGTFADRPDSDYQVRGSTAKSPDRLLLGGPGGFEAADFPEMYGRTSGGAFVDLDNDDDLDLVLARNGVPRTGGVDAWHEPSVVLRNDNGSFEVVNSMFTDRSMRQVGVLDYNADGLLDLFFVEDRYYHDGTSVLLRNNGDFTFDDVTADARLPISGLTGLSVAPADLTGDGWPDLVVSGSTRDKTSAPGLLDVQALRIFVNQQNGTFTEIDATNVTMPSYRWDDESGGIAVADLNRDGMLDLVVGQHVSGTGGADRPASNPLMAQGQPIRVYLHQGLDEHGAPQFDEISSQLGLDEIHTRAPHVEIADFDNDGWPDILAATSVGDGTKPAVFRHLGIHDGLPRFANPDGLALDERTTPPTRSGWEDLGMYRYWATGAVADFNRDGLLDSFLTEWFPDLPSRLFENTTDSPGHWLSVDIEPQHLAVGARVEVFQNGHLGEDQYLIASREATASTGYAGGVPTTVHLGLGKRPVVDVRITLPHLGGVHTFHAVRADRTLTLSAGD